MRISLHPGTYVFLGKFFIKFLPAAAAGIFFVWLVTGKGTRYLGTLIYMHLFSFLAYAMALNFINNISSWPKVTWFGIIAAIALVQTFWFQTKEYPFIKISATAGIVSLMNLVEVLALYIIYVELPKFL